MNDRSTGPDDLIGANNPVQSQVVGRIPLWVAIVVVLGAPG